MPVAYARLDLDKKHQLFSKSHHLKTIVPILEKQFTHKSQLSFAFPPGALPQLHATVGLTRLVVMQPLPQGSDAGHLSGSRKKKLNKLPLSIGLQHFHRILHSLIISHYFSRSAWWQLNVYHSVIGETHHIFPNIMYNSDGQT